MAFWSRRDTTAVRFHELTSGCSSRSLRTSCTTTARSVRDARSARALAIETAMFGVFQSPSWRIHERRRNSSVSVSMIRNRPRDNPAAARSIRSRVQSVADCARRPGCQSPAPQYVRPGLVHSRMNSICSSMVRSRKSSSPQIATLTAAKSLPVAAT
ncbi:hypothetical protein C6V83_00075 [Gordonia iterans]|uniref:Uncharacterized protein n=1 Tax=Gordonia iterans TaxID=1004901 RepID=A0A2S0KB85_9ACTN|nr:hypothetical protein C6V83_00075 [Gordonia iterans]